MIIYSSTKNEFRNAVLGGDIEIIIERQYREKLGKGVSNSEIAAWRNSLNHMDDVIEDNEIPENCGICIELVLPQTSKRIDFIITGKDETGKDNVIIVELKQWSKAELTEKDAIVKTAIGRGIREVSHPSYQAWTYAAYLQDYNTAVYQNNIGLIPCAFLHNYKPDNVIDHPFYSQHLEKAPVFLKNDKVKLREFVKKYIKKGDERRIIFTIDKGEIKPSKQLADMLSSMIKGNREFLMIDEQKLVFETALHLAKKANNKKKQVLIVEGGPGTGKSVVAINLIVELTNAEKTAMYVTKNSAPRAVFQNKLTGTLTKTRISNLFKSSGSFIDSQTNEISFIAVDEAHRLNEKSGLYGNEGDHQIKELINASLCTTFFIDEDQRVTLKDVGRKETIKRFAKEQGADVTELELRSQFRCNGSDAYLAFLDNLLQIRETANPTLEGIDYDFNVFDDPNTLFREIEKKNKKNNKSRVVAGYCWDWNSKSKPGTMDIVIPEHNFEKQWNLRTDGSLWIQQPKSVEQIGCIHTCQGLEVDYIGVIIGPDLIVRNGEVLVDPTKRSKGDHSIRGWKKLIEKNPKGGKEEIKTIIKNTYRTLMTRGMKGCYVWAVDEETNECLKAKLNS